MTTTSLPPSLSWIDRPCPTGARTSLGGPAWRCPSGRFRASDSPTRFRGTDTISGFRTGGRRSGERPALAPVDQATPPAESVADPRSLTELRAAVAAAPGDVDLRLRLARRVLDGDDSTTAMVHVALVLQQQPDHGEAVALMQAAMVATAPGRRTGRQAVLRSAS